jgi:hypothetical protein
MQTHDQFEELCAVAAMGSLETSEAKMLEAHLEECASCRSVLADLSDIHAQWLPELPNAESFPHSDRRVRQAILSRAASQGAQFSKAAWSLPQKEDVRQWPSRLWWMVAAAVLVFALGAATPLYERFRRRPVLTTNAVPANAENDLHNGALPDPKNLALDLLSQTKQRELALEKALAASRYEQRRLQEQLTEQETKTSALVQSNEDSARMVAELNRQLESARAGEAKTNAELTTLKLTEAANEGFTRAQQQEVQELHDKLGQESASVERERQLLSAGREIRDLISARNLHIIDVYDTNGQGKTQKAFGRVFFTEGKSLVFYAYDLGSHQTATEQYAFFLWGKRDSTPQNIKNLGRLNKDDQSQKRWVLTITDPSLLTEIDSVFVTLESAGKSQAKPSGKPLLSAFLGSPANHP